MRDCLDFPRLTLDCASHQEITPPGPYHYYPATGDVYDVTGTYLGHGTLSEGVLLVTPADTIDHSRSLAITRAL